MNSFGEVGMPVEDGNGGEGTVWGVPSHTHSPVPRVRSGEVVEVVVIQSTTSFVLSLARSLSFFPYPLFKKRAGTQESSRISSLFPSLSHTFGSLSFTGSYCDTLQ